MVSATRAGQYVDQLRGYKAFIPNPLPPVPDIIMDDEMWQRTYPNANKLVNDLCDVGLLEEITGQKRNRAFAYAPYLDIFKES